MNIMLLAKLVATIHLAENKEMMYNQFMQVRIMFQFILYEFELTFLLTLK